MEKNLLKVPASQISGSLGQDESGSIFPAEFEEYTFAYLVSEAHKVERKVFASRYSSSLSAVPQPGQAGQGALLDDERRIEEKLQNLSAIPQAPAEKPAAGISISVPKFEIPKMGLAQPPLPPAKYNVKSQVSANASPKPIEPPAEEGKDNVPSAAEGFEAGRPESKGEEQAVPTPHPAKSPYKGQAAPPPIPLPAQRKGRPAPIVPGEELPPRAKEEADFGEEEAPLPAEGKENGEEAMISPQDEAGPEKEGVLPSPEEEAEIPGGRQTALPEEGKGKPSRISPRLRAIIEEKLRKEESERKKTGEKEGKAEERGGEPPAQEEGAEGGGPVFPSEQAETGRREEPAAGQGEIIMSARQRLLRKLQPPPKEGRTAEEEPAPQQEEKGVAAEPEESKAAPVSGEAPALPEEKGEEESSVPAKAAGATGPLLIKPIFPGGQAEGKEGEQPASRAPDQEERLRRIQRIIEELSPDKYKARAIQQSLPAESPQEEEKGKRASAAKKKPAAKKAVPMQEEENEGAAAALPGQEEPAARPEQEEAGSGGEPSAGSRGEEVPEGREEEQERPKAARSKKGKKPVRAGKKAGRAAIAKENIAGFPQAKGKQAAKRLQQKTAAPASKKAAATPLQQEAAAQKEVQAARLRQKAIPLQKEKPAEGTPLKKPPVPAAARPFAPVPQKKIAIPPKQAPQEQPEETVKEEAEGLQKSLAEEEAEKVQEQPQETEKAQPVPLRRGVRILPGGLSVASGQPSRETYLQPVRRRVMPGMAAGEPGEGKQGPEEAEEEKPLAPVPQKKTRLPAKQPEEGEESEAQKEEPPEETIEAGARQQPEEEVPEETEEKDTQAEGEEAPAQKTKAGADEQEEGEKKVPPALMKVIEKSIPKKAASDEPVERTGQDAEEEGRRSRTAALFEAKLRAFEAGKGKPPEPDSLEAPPPPEDEKSDEPPLPPDYDSAKQEFRRKMESEGVREAAKAESEELLEQYAKENVVWLYEIYKMGGMSREDFLHKVREKAADEKGQAAAEPQAPDNPALASINKELDKRKK